MTQDKSSVSSYSDDNVRALTETALSLPARVGHVALLLVSCGVSILLLALLLTENSLPLRTRVGFYVMLAIGLSWMVYAGWVLRYRYTLLVNQRIVAGWMSVIFSSLYTVAALGLGINAGSGVGLAAAALGAGMTAVASILLARARRHRKRLLARRRELEKAMKAE